MEDEKLIRSVRRYKFLYDLSHPYYTDGESKDKAWTKISENVKQPASACKVRWQKLRDSYRRFLNKRRFKSPSSKLKKWTYENDMSFMQKHFIMRSGDLTSDEFVMLEGSQSSQPFHNDTPIQSDSKAHVAWELERMRTGNEGTRSNESVSENVPFDVTQNDVWNDLSHYSNTNAEDCVSDISSTMNEMNKQGSQKTENSEAELLKTAAFIAQSLKNKEDSRTRDELDNFFMNVASTVKKFSPYSQAIAKNKIFSLVSRCELEHIASLS